jgi:hypothetical protein
VFGEDRAIMKFSVFPLLVAATALLGGPVLAQDTAAPPADAPPPDTAAAEAAAPEEDAPEAAALLSDAELQTLVAPVALYPDTLLIQVLVAATEPLEVVKAERFLADNADADPATLQPAIEAEGWDASVGVLTTAFPDVIVDMATHIEWTETVGDAMLAQSDDVLDAVQVMRNLAIDSGALVSGEQQTVTRAENAPVVITPTDPEVVYVPQYEPDNVWGDALVAGAVGFGTFAVLDAIFDDDDDWNDYWGCRNCGGWNGGPIVRDPNVDIDVDGNVNIGNRIDRDRLDGLGDGESGWRPDPDKGGAARDKIAARRDDAGTTSLPIKRPEGRADDLRASLSERSGAADIARPGADGGRPDLSAITRPDRERPAVSRPGTRPAADRAAAVRNTADRPAIAKKAVAHKPAAAKRPEGKINPKKGQAIKKKAPGNKAKAASKRGKVKRRKNR